MAITNGYDTARVLPALRRMGWKQPTQMTEPVISATNLLTTSGRYWEEGHAAVSIENLFYTQQDKGVSDANFNTFLSKLVDSVILEALALVFNNSQYKESGVIYEKVQNTAKTTHEFSDSFVGIRIAPLPDGVTANITNAMVTFDTNATFDLHLFNDLVGEVGSGYPIAAQANKQTTISLSLPLTDESDVAKAGSWFFGFFTADIGTAKMVDYGTRKKMYHYFGTESIVGEATGTSSFDTESYSSSSDMYGLNLSISVYQDINEQIVNNAHLFDELLIKLMAVKVIELMMGTNRSNATERDAKIKFVQLDRDLNMVTTPENPFNPGLKQQILKEAKSVRYSFFPKEKPRIHVPNIPASPASHEVNDITAND